MEKVDVAVQSYKKPESLIYTLLSLKEHSKNPMGGGNLIDNIWINDDISGEDTTKHYQDEKFIKAMSPINIKLRIAKKKTKPGRSNHIFPFPSYMHQYLIKDLRRYIQDIFMFNLAPEDDIRYQWAINNTKASKLLLIHDDIMFKGNIIEKYLEEFEKNPNLIIVGDLGQCNICAHKNVCSPEKILKKEYPSKIYPLTERREKAKGIFGRKYERSCRINEWCCMLDVAKTKTVKAHFGNCVDGGDTGAFWFEKAFKAGFDFTDPLLPAEEKQKYYFHCWEGNTGHSIWLGTQTYKKDLINSKLYEDFGYKLSI